MDFASATRVHYSPHPKPPLLPPNYTHPHAVLAQSRGPSDDMSRHGLGPSEAMDVFVRGIEALPDDILQQVVLEKFASAERSRHQLLLATWDVEATKRRVHTLERVQQHLEATHALSDSEYKFWHDTFTDRGLPELKEDELYYGKQLSTMAREADREATELSIIVDHARKRGLNVASLNAEMEADDDDAVTPRDSPELGKEGMSGE